MQKKNRNQQSTCVNQRFFFWNYDAQTMSIISEVMQLDLGGGSYLWYGVGSHSRSIFDTK